MPNSVNIPINEYEPDDKSNYEPDYELNDEPDYEINYETWAYYEYRIPYGFDNDYEEALDVDREWFEKHYSKYCF